MSISVLVADDHRVMRSGLIAMLEEESDIEVVAEADDGAECLEKAAAFRPDVVLLDLNMPRLGGLDAIEKLVEMVPSTRVLVLTMHDDAGYLRKVLGSGGAGYVLKSVAADELLRAIRSVAAGGVFLLPHHARLLAAGEEASIGVETGEAWDSADVGHLSERETEVFRLVALGYTNGEIADQLYLSVKTIETYKTRLMKKLGVRGRASLVKLALEIGLIGGEQTP
jgi:two-component system response regulator NreC